MSENKEEPVVVHSIWYKKIPTLLTIGNSLCGFTAILWCLQAYERAILKGNGQVIAGNLPDVSLVQYIFASCAWLVIGAMVFDALDGNFDARINIASINMPFDFQASRGEYGGVFMNIAPSIDRRSRGLRRVVESVGSR